MSDDATALNAGEPAEAPEQAEQDAAPAAVTTKPAGWDADSARRVQQAMLPPEGILVSGLHVATAYMPALNVGGDFYDLLEPTAGRVVAFIGDASGHGVTAALMMSRASAELRRLAQVGVSPAEALQMVSSLLVEELPADKFVTALYVSVQVLEGVVTLAGAGHLPPMVKRQSSVEILDIGAGLPLGIAGESIPEVEATLEPGDVLLLYTDGIADLFAAPSDPLGLQGLRVYLEAAPRNVQAIEAALRQAVERSTGRDDSSLVALQLADRVAC